MKDPQEILYALALQAAKGIGCIRAKKIIQFYGSATQVYEAFQQNKLENFGGIQKHDSIFKKEHLLKAEQEIDKALKNHLNILYFLHQDYPKHLLHCDDAPLVLFIDSQIDLNSCEKIISIVGTRNMTPYGQEFCKQLILDLKPYQPLIVSGFAFGVDICAHLEAIHQNLNTLAVLAHGFGTLYPKEHKKYYHSIQEQGGFISEFDYNTPPYKENFLKRNRIVAGISQATIVIESASKGGSLVTASLANQYNRDVFAVPGRAHDTYSKGCNQLIKKHMSSILTCSQDLIEQMGWQKKKIPKTIQPKLFVDLEGDEAIIYDFLNEVPLHLDEISKGCGIPIYKIAHTILQLELKALIQVLPGKLIKKL